MDLFGQCGCLHRQSRKHCAYLDTLPAMPRSHCPWSGIRAPYSRNCLATAAAPTAPRVKTRTAAQSILDSVTGLWSGRRLGPQDQGKVDEYTDAVRDVERRIQMAERQSDVELPALAEPLGAPPVFEDHATLVVDLKVIAFLVRSLPRHFVLHDQQGQSPRPCPQTSVAEGALPALRTTSNNIPELIDLMSKINRYHAALFAAVPRWLSATPDGDGNLLDHITILYGAGISNSNGHAPDNLPLLLVGGGSGRIKGR